MADACAAQSVAKSHRCQPEDCSLIGFDDLFFAAYTTPKLTTITQDIRKKAQIAIDVLFRHIQNPNLPAESIILDVQLVEQGQ